MADDDRELLETFLEEAKEYLEVLDRGLLSLETSPNDPELIHSIFRAAHSLKGNAALIGFDDIKELSHSLESVFDSIREGKISYSEKMYETLFQVVDKLSFMVGQVTDSNPVTRDYSQLLEQLKKYTSPGFSPEKIVKGEHEPPMKVEASINDPEVLSAFCEDTKEVLCTLQEDLFNLEKSPESKESIDTIYNKLHSLTGGASFLNLESVCELSSSLEALLSPLKNSTEHMAHHGLVILGFLFEGVHLLEHLLRSATDHEAGKPDFRPFVIEIEEFRNKMVSEKESIYREEGTRPEKPEPLSGSGNTPQVIRGQAPDSIRVSSRKLDETIKLMGEMISGQGISRDRISLLKEAQKLSGKTTLDLSSLIHGNHFEDPLSFNPPRGLIGIIAIEEQILDPGQVVDILHMQKKTNLRFGEAAVSIGYLEEEDVRKLVELQRFHQPHKGTQEELKEIKKRVKETLKTAEQLHQTVKKLVKASIDEHLLQETLTNDLQQKALKMRMLPLSTVFNTFSRVVRDTAKAVNKSVYLEIVGWETELDKKIIEKIGDPLIHMIRNSIDHGIETPEIRLEREKPEHGTIKVQGGYEGNGVLITVTDDGAGIDPGIIMDRAEKKGLYPREVLNGMSNEQVINLIFHPGFSTSESVTHISGRGVGLDIVKKNIVEELKGAIEIKTSEGRGTTFNIRLPLTLALIRVLNVTISDHQFSIPLNYITEIINIPRLKLIQVVDQMAFLLKEKVVPIVSINEILGIKSSPAVGTNILVVLVRTGSEMVGLNVDAINSEENTVIKPLPNHMKNLHLVAGVRISSENDIVNVLHLPNILKLARDYRVKNPDDKETVDKQLTTILLVDDSAMARTVEKKILEEEGYHVDTATDAYKGSEMLKNSRYDLIVTDVEMPGKDGFTFTHELRMHSYYRHIPVIIASSLDKRKFRERAKEVGANAYIVKKNFNSSTISSLVRSLLK